MINHIAAKFVGLSYSAIPSETFKKNHQDLIEVLRPKFPRFVTPVVKSISLNLGNEAQDTEQTSNMEIHMVSADGKLGIKIGNQGVFFSVDGYISFEELIIEFESVVDSVCSVLAITHFFQVYLRNINLFPEVSSSEFKDIRDENYWGRQSLSTLSGGFSCSGAATRHEYFSSDYMRQLQISSAVILGAKRSYIPQDEWDIWRLRGVIPVVKDVELQIDITGIMQQSPANQPERQLEVKEFNWDEISKQLKLLHDDINGVYGDIIIKE